MATYRYPLFAREGWPILAVTVSVALLLHLFSWKLALPVWLTCAWVIFVFRDPPRRVPSVPLAIVSPVDGKVLSVTRTRDDRLQREALKIAITMRWFDVYSLRSPTEGKVIKTWFSGADGKNKASASLWIQTDEMDDVVASISGGFWWWKPRCEVHSGERVGQGQRCGFMDFGSEVEVLLPESSTAEVKTGDLIVSGESIIAHLHGGSKTAR